MIGSPMSMKSPSPRLISSMERTFPVPVSLWSTFPRVADVSVEDEDNRHAALYGLPDRAHEAEGEGLHLLVLEADVVVEGED